MGFFLPYLHDPAQEARQALLLTVQHLQVRTMLLGSTVNYVMTIGVDLLLLFYEPHVIDQPLFSFLIRGRKKNI